MELRPVEGGATSGHQRLRGGYLPAFTWKGWLNWQEQGANGEKMLEGISTTFDKNSGGLRSFDKVAIPSVDKGSCKKESPYPFVKRHLSLQANGLAFAQVWYL